MIRLLRKEENCFNDMVQMYGTEQSTNTNGCYGSCDSPVSSGGAVLGALISSGVLVVDIITTNKYCPK